MVQVKKETANMTLAIISTLPILCDCENHESQGRENGLDDSTGYVGKVELNLPSSKERIVSWQKLANQNSSPNIGPEMGSTKMSIGRQQKFYNA